MKKIALCLGLYLTVCLFASASLAQTVLKAVAFAPKNEAHLTEVPMFLDMVAKDSSGRLTIDWVGGPEVIAPFDQALALKSGSIDMLLYYPSSYFTSLMPVANAKGLSQFPAWEERKNGCFDLWVKVFREKANAEYLGSFHSIVPLRIYMRKNIERLDDLRGTKIRTMPLYIPFLQALGVSPVTTPGSEMYTAMERGMVDGFIWGGYGIKSLGLDQVTKCVVEPGVFQLEAFTGTNLGVFNKLPRDLQLVLRNSMEKMERIATDSAIKIADAELASLQKAGIKIAKLPPEDAKRLTDLSYEVTWKKVIADDPVYGPQFRKLSTR